MVSLWRLYRGGETKGHFVGMGGGGAIHGWTPGLLPDAGGVMDQPAIMIEAFDLMNAAEAEIRAGETDG